MKSLVDTLDPSFYLGVHPTEKQVQVRVIALYKGVGCHIYPMSQYRASHVAAGVPDLYVVHPRGAWWHEVKRPGGKQSDKQRAFQLAVERAGVGYVLGGPSEAAAQLERVGVLKDGWIVDTSGFRP